MDSTRRNDNHAPLVLLLAFLGIFVMPFAQSNVRAFAASDQPTTTTVKNNTKKAATSAYPSWVYQAIVGTPYSAQQFVNLPSAKQVWFLKTLHPEINPNVVSQTALSPALANTIPTQNANQSLTISGFTNFTTMAAAATTPAQSYIDEVPEGTDTGTAAATFASTATSGIATTELNPGGIDPATLTSSDFKLDSASELSSNDVTLDYDASGKAVTLSVKKMSVLDYNGKKVIYNVTKNGQSLKITFNLWRPDINRVHANIETQKKNQIALQYAYGYIYTPNSTDINGDPTPNTTETHKMPEFAYNMDIPNVNIVIGGKTRIVSTFGDSGEPPLDDYDEYQTTSGLLIGNKNGEADISSLQSSGNVGGGYLTAGFDDVKHIHMWPDTDDNDTIYLSYDGYITDPNKLSSYNMPTDEPIILHVENTIKPTDDQQQMAMSEVVTNPKTIYGNQTNTKDLSNLYFTREYDTALGHPNNGDGSPDDGVPIRYSGIGTSGPRNGKIEGLVIRPSDLTNSDYKYQVAFNFNSDFAPDGWMGTTFTTYPTGGSMQNGAAVQPNAFMVSEDGTGIFYKKHPDTGSQVWSIFNKADDVGMANTDPDKANTIAFGSKTKNNAYDTSILMKWSPNYVGDFKPGKNVVMGFNADLGTALAPGLEADKSYLRMDNTRNEVPVSLQDLDSTNVSVRYTIDTPLDSKHITGDDSDGSKKLLSATGVSSDYTPYTGKITDTSDLQKLQTPQEGGHTLYLYAVDDTGYVSRIRTITVNKPIYFNLQATVQATDTSDKLIPDTKVQQYYAFAGDSYNYIDGTKNLFDPATTDWTYATAGNAPDTLTVDDHNYKKTGTPSNASGSLTPTQTDGVTAKKPITINYHYIDQGYLKLTVPNVNFGQHKIGMPGQYYAETLDDPKGTKGDNQGQLSFENTTPNKNLSIYLKATKPLTNMQTHQSIPDGLAFQPAKSGTTAESITDNSVLIYKTSSDTSAVISDTWKTNGVYTAGPVLTVTDKNDGVGQGTYTGELEWTMTTSTN